MRAVQYASAQQGDGVLKNEKVNLLGESVYNTQGRRRKERSHQSTSSRQIAHCESFRAAAR